jgi:large subunit ribosomal protein L24
MNKKQNNLRKVKKPVIHVRKNDQVTVITGDHRGKTGRVLRVFPDTNRVVVEGVNLVKRHTKPRGNKQGGIVEKEASIHASNVKKVD